MKFSPKSILKMITAGPVRYKAIVPAWDKPKRAKLRKIFDDLLADGAIKQVYIDRFPYYVLGDWAPTDGELLADIEGRCRPTVDGCLLWSEYVDEVVGPIHNGSMSRPKKSVRRIVWEMHSGGTLNFRDVIKPECGNAACIAFAHLRKTTRAEPLAGRPKAPGHAMRIALAAQAGAKKMDWDKVHAIRASTEKAAVLAMRYDVSKQNITAIRRGDIWKERDTGLFSGLINERRA